MIIATTDTISGRDISQVVGMCRGGQSEPNILVKT